MSVYDKSGLEDFGAALNRLGVDIVATSGTAASLQTAGIPAVPLSQLTAVPHSFLGGRTKTLQPSIYAGLLADRDNAEHMQHLDRHEFAPIDLLCINLHPFGDPEQDETRASTVVSHIDIGGPMLLRAAALNHRHVAVLTRPSQYADVIATMEANDNELPESLLVRLAGHAFAVVAGYETQVSAWFSERLAEIAEDERQGPMRISWRRCEECGGATVVPSAALCLRHVEPSIRKQLLTATDGAVDLRNVQVTATLMDEILRAVPIRGGRPHMSLFRADWAQFEGPIDFRAARVTSDVDLGGARFSGTVSFDGLSVDGEMRCRDTRFRDASFAGIRVRRLTTFRGADFSKARFDGATFEHQAVFESTHFAGPVSFRAATFGGHASFMAAEFRGEAAFQSVTWGSNAKFRDARFEVVPAGDDAARFHEASWPEPAVRHGGGKTGTSEQPGQCTAPRVFIASSVEQLPIAQAIQTNLDQESEPHVWSQGFSPGTTTTAAVISELQQADFAVFVLGGEDQAVVRDEKVRLTRDNVILELGLSAGLLGLDRTFLVKPRRIAIHLPTDILGITLLDFDESRSDKLAALGAACNRMLTVIRDKGAGRRGA